jgi:hypothetical protein
MESTTVAVYSSREEGQALRIHNLFLMSDGENLTFEEMTVDQQLDAMGLVSRVERNWKRNGWAIRR